MGVFFEIRRCDYCGGDYSIDIRYAVVDMWVCPHCHTGIEQSRTPAEQLRAVLALCAIAATLNTEDAHSMWWWGDDRIVQWETGFVDRGLLWEEE